VPAHFTRVREDFACLHCGRLVHGDGYTNHCPYCLWSRHVDEEHPGDRAAICGAAMEPIAAMTEGNGMVVVQRCTGCGLVWRNKVSRADDREAVLALFGRAVPDATGAPSATRPARRERGRTGSRKYGR
jgi:hypothetical protein